MKCTKCGYIGLEEVGRCKNCGYDFALAQAAGRSELELPLRPDEADVAPDDLYLRTPRHPTGRPKRGPTPSRPVDLDRLIGDRPPTPPDLPLFPEIPTEAEDLAFAPSHPSRPPLAVRRATPPPARPRAPAPSQPEPRSLGLEAGFSSEAESGVQITPALPPAEPATAGARAVGALIDGGLLGVLNATVLYFTLRLCRLGLSEIALLPPVPLAGFLALLNGGYFVGFTAAGGQTIGKMAVGTKVVSEGDRSVPFGQATVRTLAYLASVLPAGLGFVLAFVGQGRRGLHDRLAGTRVIRVPSP
jgi:uncharacterized RDD family membrane protein YckC